LKMLWVICNESIAEDVRDTLEGNGVSGYTVWREVVGTHIGHKTHWGDAIFPGRNWTFMTVDEEEHINAAIQRLKEMKKEDRYHRAGIKAFTQDADAAV